MVQKGQGRGLDNHMLPLTPHVQAIERFDRAGGLTRGGAKGGEIMDSHQQSCGLVHRVCIQFMRNSPGAACIKRQRMLGGQRQQRAAEQRLIVTVGFN